MHAEPTSGGGPAQTGPTTLRALRLALGLSQEGWAAQLGYAWSTVQRWESGEIEPQRHTLLHIREVLRRPDFRRRISAQPDLERQLMAAGLIVAAPGSLTA